MEHPLKSVKKIEFFEINFHLLYRHSLEAKKLNTLLLKSLCNKNLKAIKIKSYIHGSVISGSDIQPIFKCAPNLKSFSYNGSQSSQKVDLSFENLSKLTKVKLIKWIGSSSTIESLKSCTKLKEMVIIHEPYYLKELRLLSSAAIKTILVEKHFWNLKRLELTNIIPNNDDEIQAITAQIPNLECLKIDLNKISDDGMEKIGENNPHLKILMFKNRNITNRGLNKLTRHLPKLEGISITCAHNITEKGVISLSENCKNLRFVEIIHFKQIKESGIAALRINCRNLRAVNFSYCGPVSLNDIALHFVIHSLPKLRYLELYNIKGVSKKELEMFYDTFKQFCKFYRATTTKTMRHMMV